MQQLYKINRFTQFGYNSHFEFVRDKNSKNEGKCLVYGVIPKVVVDELLMNDSYKDYIKFSEDIDEDLKDFYDLVFRTSKFSDDYVLNVEISSILALIAFTMRLENYYNKAKGISYNNLDEAIESTIKEIM